MINRKQFLEQRMQAGFERTVKGNVMEIESPLQSNLNNLSILGNSIQNGAPTPETSVEVESVGEKTKNLIEYPYLDTSKTLNGLTFIDNGDGTITVNGTAESDTVFNIATQKTSIWDGIIPNEVYTLSVNVDGEYTGNISCVCNYYPEGSSSYNNWMSSAVNKLVTKACPTDITGIRSYIYIYAEAVLDNVTIKPQLEKGETATPYEPYGKYKIPVITRGKNLLPKATEDKVIKGVSWTVNEDGTLNVDGTMGSSDISDCYIFGGLSANDEQFVLSNNAVFSSNYIGDGNNLLIARTSAGNYYAYIDFPLQTIPKDTVIYGVCIRLYNRTFSQKNITYQLEYGTTATPYEPGHEPITTNIYLDEPLRKVGDYADYIDFESRKLVRKIYHEFLDTVTTVSSDSTTYKRFLTDISKKPFLSNISEYSGSTIGYAISNKFKRSTYIYNQLGRELNSINLIQSYITTQGINRVAYTFDDSSITTIERAQEKIGDGFDVYYVLAEPSEESIELPELIVSTNTSVISVDTTVPCSSIEAKYRSRILRQ